MAQCEVPNTLVVISLSHFSLSHFSSSLHLGKDKVHQLTRTLPRDISPKIYLLP